MTRNQHHLCINVKIFDTAKIRLELEWEWGWGILYTSCFDKKWTFLRPSTRQLEMENSLAQDQRMKETRPMRILNFGKYFVTGDKGELRMKMFGYGK